MGVRQSMEVAKAVMAFCQQLGTCERIDGIIDDEKFRTQLSDLLAEAPSSFKQFICDAQKPPENEAENGAPVTHRALNSLRISSGPQFDPSLGPELLRWYNDPETIFVGSNAPEDDTSISSPSSSHSSFLASIYLLTNKKRTIDNVRWRLCLIALAKVVDRLEGVYLTDSLVEQVADIVDPKRVKIKNGKAEIRGWLHPLLSAASRYRLLSEELGTGELCCLPPDIGESLWTHYLPKSGEVHDTCVKWLLDRDIEKLSSTIINSSDREVVTVSLAAKNVVEFWRRKLDIFGQRYIQPGRFDFTQAQDPSSQSNGAKTGIPPSNYPSEQTRKRKRPQQDNQHNQRNIRFLSPLIPPPTVPIPAIPEGLPHNFVTAGGGETAALATRRTEAALLSRVVSEPSAEASLRGEIQAPTNQNQPSASDSSALSAFPQPEATDAWSVVGMQTHSGTFPHNPVTDIPQPEAIDAWSVVGMQTHSGTFPHNHVTDIPQPEATDAWSVVGMQTHSGTFPHNPVTDIPQPEAADAWSVIGMQTHSGTFPHNPVTDIPQPDAADAWSVVGMQTHSGTFPHDPLTDIPQPEAIDAWSVVGMQTHSGTFLHNPVTDIPQPEATDAWSVIGMQTHSGTFPHDHLTDISQPNRTDAWATVDPALHGRHCVTLMSAGDAARVTSNFCAPDGSPSPDYFQFRGNSSITATPNPSSIQSSSGLERRNASFIMV